MSNKNGIVRLKDLPEKSVCVRLNDKIQKSMIESALKLVPGRYNLAKRLSVNVATIYDFEKGRFRSVSLDFLKKLSSFLVENGYEEFSLEKLETEFIWIKTKWAGKCIFNPKFSINFNTKEGVKIISGIFFDGGLTSGVYPFYTNNEENLVNQMISNVNSVIGNIEYIKRKDENNFRVEFPKIFGYILLNGLEILPGSKLFNDPPIPEFIMKNPILYLNFIQQAFDDEGTVNLGRSDGGSKAIQLWQYNSRSVSPIRLVRLKQLLEKVGIDVSGPYGPTRIYNSKKGYTSYGWIIQISNQADIRKFAERINFSLPKKKDKLVSLLNSYKTPLRFKRGRAEEEILKTCKELKNENKRLTIKSIARKTNRKRYYISQLTSRLAKEGRLKVTKDRMVIKGISGFQEKEFDLV